MVRWALLAFLLLQSVFTSPSQGAAPWDSPLVNVPALVQNCVKYIAEGYWFPVSKGRLVYVRNPEIKKLLRTSYDGESLSGIQKYLGNSLEIEVSPRGTVKAATRKSDKNGEDDHTNYDAAWVRDMMWAYLALRSQPDTRDLATKVIFCLLNYFASDDQLLRFGYAIAYPEHISGLNGFDLAPHIRFDPTSEAFHDPQRNDTRELWDHRQNDALGFFYDYVLRDIQAGAISETSITEKHWRALAYFPAYFSAVEFWNMEDTGHWEEGRAIRTSSVAYITSALETLQNMDGKFWRKLRTSAKKFNFGDRLLRRHTRKLVENGYRRMRENLEKGGESPTYPKFSPVYREADIALLALIYPTRLSQLTKVEKLAILQMVDSLVGDYGVRRYQYDSYQAAGYWGLHDRVESTHWESRSWLFHDIHEAEWFFDSWLSVAYGEMYRQTRMDCYLKNQTLFLNRALGQLTGGTKESPQLAADGRPVPPLALPESTNIVFVEGKPYPAPSPITPLQWAKASLTLSLHSMEQSLKP